MSEIEIEAVHAPASIECVDCAYEGRGLHNAMPFAGIHERGNGWTNVSYGPCPVCDESTTALLGFEMLNPITRHKDAGEGWYV